MRRTLTARCGGACVSGVVSAVALVCLLPLAVAAQTAAAGTAATPPPAAAAVPAIPGFELMTGGTLDIRWMTAEGDAVAAPPALDDDTAYVAMKSGRLVAIALDSGQTRWSVDSDTTWAPAVGGGRIYLAMAGGLRALDRATGRVVWQRTLTAAAAAPPYWDTGWLVVSLENGDLAALRADDGEPIWRAELGATVRTPPAPALDALYLGLDDGRVVALALATGAELWSRRIDGMVTGLLALDDQLVVGSTARSVQSLDLRRGTVRWNWRVGGPVVGAAAADDRRIYVVAFDHLLRAVDRGNGNLRWRRALSHRPAGSPILVGSMVLVPSLSAELSAYDAVTGAPALAIASTGEVTGETHIRPKGSPGGTRLLAVSVEGRLLAFAPRIEPPATPFEALPGLAVSDVPPQADAPPPPVSPSPREWR